MQPLTLDDLHTLDEYERRRPEFRRRIIALKRPRRVVVGEYVTLLFENRETVLSQVMEMIRIERIVEPAARQVELDAYTSIIPGDNELSVTIFIAAPGGLGNIREMLDRLVGLNEHFSLHVNGEIIRGVFEPAQYREDRISAVQYVKFPLTEAQKRQLLRDDADVRVVIDHPNFSHETQLSAETLASLRADLREEVS